MKKYIKYIIILILIVAAIIIWNHYRKAKYAPEWRTMTPSPGAVREVVTATGSLNPYVLVNVGTEVSGKIEKIYKDYNDRVKRGDLLAKLDTEILATSLEVARGNLSKAITALQEAELDYNLLQELYEQGMTPEYDLTKAGFKVDTAQQNVANARLDLQRAEKNLANAHITSPIDGVIVSRAVDEGQTVAASLNSPTLFIIANNLDQMQITAGVDEADIGKIKMNQPVEFTVDAYPADKFWGQVKQIRLNPTTESNVVTYDVIIDARNPEGKLLPGMTTNVTFIINSKENVLRVPEAATRFNPSKELWELFGLKWSDDLLTAGRNAIKELSLAGNTGSRQPNPANNPGSTLEQTKPSAGTPGRIAVVWMLNNGIPEAKAIRVGISDGAYVELIEGLDENAILVTGVIYKDPKQAINAGSPTMRRF
ncbi:MAG: HlyD family secretion protein [Candidatus Cloacimonadota bacterium]|nr:HlyD family secretion protein [Candidatus Cloacimonadota bacterium]